MITPNPSQIVKERGEVLDRIAGLLQSAATNIEEAAKLYVEGIDGSPEFHDSFRQRFPRLNGAFIANLERVGRGILDSRLLMSGASACDILARLPPAQQSRILEDGVDVWVGESDTRHMRVEEMPASLIRQVVSRSGHILSPSEQAAQMEGKRSVYRESMLRRKTMDVRGKEVPYEVVNGCVKIIHAPCILKAKDLRFLLSEVEKKK